MVQSMCSDSHKLAWEIRAMHVFGASIFYKHKSTLKSNLHSTQTPNNNNLASTLSWEKKAYTLINAK